DAGQLLSTNRADGSLIVAIAYVNNTDIIVTDDDGFTTDTDTLTLLGTDPSAPGTSGNERVVANFTNAGDAANPIVTVFDTQGTPALGDDTILYRLRTNPVAGAAPLTFD